MEETAALKATNVTVGSDIQKALNKKIKLRRKLVRAEHHLKFFFKRKQEKGTPRGLKIQKEIRLMDSPGSHHTQATIQKYSESRAGDGWSFTRLPREGLK